MVLLVLVGWGAVCASLGLVLGNIARTEGQALGIGVLSANLLAGLGGCWWPIEVTPETMQTLAKILPTGWPMDALHQLVSFQAGAGAAVPHLIAMVVATVLLAWIGARSFRFQ
jgi:ABC-type multidrug transport system permease subunit